MSSLFLKFLNIWINKPGIWSQKFGAEVTKLWTPDEIRRLDGTHDVGILLGTEKISVPVDSKLTLLLDDGNSLVMAQLATAPYIFHS